MGNIWRVLIAALAACGAMIVLIFSIDIYRAIMGSRIPTKEKILRPPGESLTRRITQIDEKLSYTILLLTLAPVLFAFQTQSLPFGQFLALQVPVTVLFAIPLALVHRQRRNHALGLLGERAVGEELNQLLREGCHVFHDYPGGPDWNIDHVVVAPSGVYAVETKTRKTSRPQRSARLRNRFRRHATPQDLGK